MRFKKFREISQTNQLEITARMVGINASRFKLGIASNADLLNGK